MIHQATQSAKFVKFVRKLRPLVGNVPVKIETIAVGLLERLWHTSIVSAPRGDIGRLDDESIAESIGWDGDGEVIVAVLVDCGWVDRSVEHRLVIHDWAEHSPRHIKQNIHRKGGFVITDDAKYGPNVSSETVSQSYLGPNVSPETHAVRSETPVVSSETVSIDLSSTPNLTKPNLTKPTLSLSQGSFEPDQTPELKPYPEPKPKPKPRASQVRVPPELSVAWSRWCDFRLAIDGRPIGDTQAETILMDLGRRGAEKAIRDIEFSILKSAKSILDSDNDYQKRQTAQSPKKRRVGI